jgi:hypothetical protein
LLQKDLEEIVQPGLSTIRTNSYMDIDLEYARNIMEKGIKETGEDKFENGKRYKNYPWAVSRIQIEHDSSRKCVYSPKYLQIQKLRKKEVDRQRNASKSLFSGYSSTRLLDVKLPPVKRFAKII